MKKRIAFIASLLIVAALMAWLAYSPEKESQATLPAVSKPADNAAAAKKREAVIRDLVGEKMAYLMNTSPFHEINTDLPKLTSNGTISLLVVDDLKQSPHWGAGFLIKTDENGKEFYAIELSPFFFIGPEYAALTPGVMLPDKISSEEYMKLALLHEFEHYQQAIGTRGPRLQKLFRIQHEAPNKNDPAIVRALFDIEFYAWLYTTKGAILAGWEKEHSCFKAYKSSGIPAFAMELAKTLCMQPPYAKHRALVNERARELAELHKHDPR